MIGDRSAGVGGALDLDLSVRQQLRHIEVVAVEAGPGGELFSVDHCDDAAHPQRRRPDAKRRRFCHTSFHRAALLVRRKLEEGAASGWTSNTNKACPLEAYEPPSCCHRRPLLPP